MKQAESDLAAAKRLDNDNDPATRCQAISKFQQSVEKSVKAVLDAMHSAGLIRSRTDRKHDVLRYVEPLVLIPRTADSRDLLNQLSRLFTASVIEQIGVLDSFVPQYPPKGTLARRNHEYPYQATAVDWRAPADDDAFTVGEIKRIRNCAGKLIPGLRKIMDALESIYP